MDLSECPKCPEAKFFRPEPLAFETTLADFERDTGQTITWDQALQSQEDLSPATYAWTDDVPACEIARPGVTKFV